MLKKVACAIFYSVVFIIILFNILSSFHISLFGIRFFKVATGSMTPYLKINDVIVVKSSKNLKINDVITYKDINENYITHRIIEMNGEEIVTKGDANNTTDDPIKITNVVGKLIYKTKIMGFINYILSNPLNWFMIFIIGLLVTCLIPDSKKINRKE